MISPSMRFDMSLPNFKKPLIDILSPQIERKNVPKSICKHFGCRKKALSDFLTSSSSLKRVNTGKPAKSCKLKLEDSGFLETL